ncbi:MAG: PEGA domain-containing protein [Myxococcales bacterium]|nr:PEGA domain-containing protein [Myxococcales bacterium]
MQPAPPPGSRSRLILGLFLGGILGGALLAWPRARRELAPAASPEPSLRDVVPSEVARTPEPPPAASSVRVGAEPVVSVLPAVVPAKVRPGSPPLASAVPASSKSAAPTTTETLQDGAPVRVTISTPGGEAQVYWRGESRGRTPCTLLMPPGRHTVELEPSGGPRRAVSVVARAGEPTYVSVPMERLLTAP